ncbi:hypothetical protein L208DRAFT_545798 [Tricholoma matsutake]|nr:hypothetical protein L208DRAFT_545798 [Tricholoma matsutake 945]
MEMIHDSNIFHSITQFFLAMAILAEYSFNHSPEMLAKKYTEFWLSSNWVAIKEGGRKLHIKKSTLKSEADQEGLQHTILNIALTNRFVEDTD